MPGRLSGIPSAAETHQEADFARANLIQIPSITTPKGGGALKSIDEKFEVNGANGTSAFSITIPFSKSRSDFTPRLTLAYNSGGGNSAFGLGWNIGLPSIRRRTDKMLPRYRDAENGDVFQLSGAEDLVPRLVETTPGVWQPDAFTTGSYQIKRFIPRIESAFTLIEQIQSAGNWLYWKTTTKDNVVTFYGLSTSAKVADPEDNSKIFEWLPELCFDDKGNCYQYIYTPENLLNVPNLPQEANRLNGNQPPANTYLKKILYGNTQPYQPAPSGGTLDPYNPVIPDISGYLFTLVLDYGDHDPGTPTPTPSTSWGCRLDPFSNGKPGFDMRTYRLCRRFLMFHQFPELDANPVLVKSIDLAYRYYDFQPAPADPYSLQLVEADFIASITETGWVGTQTTGYRQFTYPPFTFTYQLPVWNTAVEEVSAQNRMNIPAGLTPNYQFTDLYNEGIAGVLTEQAEGWYYNSNLGEGVFTPASLVAPKPSFTGLSAGDLQLQSLTGDGMKFIVSNKRPNLGYFELTDDSQKWLAFEAFQQYPAFDLKDPNVKWIDVNGDGMPEVVLSEEQVFTWYPAAGILGYDSPELAAKPFDEEKGPAIVFADPVQSIYLADMTGDGLTDIVRIRNGEICYWPNLGYGIFGAKVNMMNAPEFDTIDAFNPGYLRLADINGTGATDILYLGRNTLQAWLNLSGNAWGDPFEAPAFPYTASPNQLEVADFLGNGTSCVIWSSPLQDNADAPLQYIDLMGGKKPYLMNHYDNGMGKTVDIVYQSSTWFYLQDKIAGIPWITKLGFPVQCVQNMILTDTVSGTKYSTTYNYHHGYYDHPEKEYRGFARVERIDTDIFDTNAAADQTPILTRTWYHTGFYFGSGNILHQLAAEYFKNPSFTEYNLPEPELPHNMTADEAREAVRACKGMVIRQEIYALDASTNPTLAAYPYSVAEHNNNITILQPQGPNPYAAFLTVESEMITYHYERNPADPRIEHKLNTAYDKYGNIVDSYTVVYPRQPVDPAKPGGITLPGNQPLPAPVMTIQQNMYILDAHHGYTGEIITPATYRLPAPCETITCEVTGITPSAKYFSLSDIIHPSGLPVRTKLKHQRTLFLKDDLVTPLPLYTMDTMGITYQQYHLTFNASVTALAAKTTPAILQKAHYIESDTYITAGYFPATDASGEWWTPSGRAVYLKAGVPQPFFLPYQYLDAAGNATTLTYETHFLLLQTVADAMNNTTSAGIDYRVLAPFSTTDPNGNLTWFRYDGLGLLVAIAQWGKGEGDAFDAGFTSDLTPAQITNFFSDPYTFGPALQQGATTRYIYDFNSGGPFSVGTVIRRFHANQNPDPRVDATSDPYQYSFDYTDGLGRLAMRKIQADVDTGVPAPDSCDGPNPPAHRWIGSGKTVYNNKGKPVMQYEPYFSSTPAYEEAPANGVTPILHYDPVSRLIRVDFPDGSFSMTEFDAWVEIGYDQNDTVKDSAWYTNYSTSPDPEKVSAAAKAAAHYNTPQAAHLDPLGRNFYTVSFNMVGATPVFYASQVLLSLDNNPLAVIDPMGNTVMKWDYDLDNRPIHRVSMDAGERWMLHDSMDLDFMEWDSNGPNTFVHTYTYDVIQRLIQNAVTINGTPYIAGYSVYGEGISINGASDTTNNLRGRLYRQFDGSGLMTRYLYDFKGNLVQSSRIFATSFRQIDPLAPAVPWTGTAATDLSLLGPDEYISIVTYDALNRPIFQSRPFIPATPGVVITPPYNQSAVNGADITIPGYGEAGVLSAVDLYYGGGATSTAFVRNICHNEKGQRLCIQYGNNTVTRYTYDPDTFRLTRMLTTAKSGTTILQDLNLYYDPVGNITYTIDKAQPAVSYAGKTVLSDSDYTYDPIYRLIRGTGREQIAQNTVDETPANTDYRNFPFVAINPLPSPTDPLAMRPYTQIYQYDAASNMTSLQHVAGTGSYTRTLAHNNNAADRITYGVPAATPMNNQLLATTVGGNPPQKYTFDGHGNMTKLVQLSAMAWNFKDEFVSATQQAVSSGSGQTTCYTYDETGARSRKITLGSAPAGGTPARIAERLYIGNYEIYRTFDNTGKPNFQRETLDVTDDTNTIALIDNKTLDTIGTDTTKINTYYPRFQYGNHLGSCTYELDGNAAIISYEEYHPFGTTSFQATDASLDVPTKRYRYTGKERDDETGLYYYGARYYAPWLCAWTAADPSLIDDGLNLYAYVKNGPVAFKDPNGMWEMPSWSEVKEKASEIRKDIADSKITQTIRGVAYGTVESFSLNGLPTPEGSTPEFQKGRAAGNIATGIVQSTVGAYGMALGVVTAAGGGVVEIGSLGAGTPVAVPAMAAGVAMVAAGAGFGTLGVKNMQKGMKMLSEGSPSEEPQKPSERPKPFEGDPDLPEPGDNAGSSTDPEAETRKDPINKKYKGGFSPEDPVIDHEDPRAHGGADTDANKVPRSRASNAQKAGQEGNLLKDEQFMRENGMSEEDIKEANKEQWESIKNDIHAEPYDIDEFARQEEEQQMCIPRE